MSRGLKRIYSAPRRYDGEEKWGGQGKNMIKTPEAPVRPASSSSLLLLLYVCVRPRPETPWRVYKPVVTSFGAPIDQQPPYSSIPYIYIVRIKLLRDTGWSSGAERVSREFSISVRPVWPSRTPRSFRSSQTVRSWTTKKTSKDHKNHDETIPDRNAVYDDRTPSVEIGPTPLRTGTETLGFNTFPIDPN